MSTSYTDMFDNLKLARENALFGGYDTSVVYYQGVLQQLQKLMITIKEPDRRNKFQMVMLQYITVSPSEAKSRALKLAIWISWEKIKFCSLFI